jgi:hypothetical protein
MITTGQLWSLARQHVQARIISNEVWLIKDLQLRQLASQSLYVLVMSVVFWINVVISYGSSRYISSKCRIHSDCFYEIMSSWKSKRTANMDGNSGTNNWIWILHQIVWHEQATTLPECLIQENVIEIRVAKFHKSSNYHSNAVQSSSKLP